jgi:sugar lactone lactonase YvrE
MTETIPPDAVFAIHRANAMTGETPYWDNGTGIVWWIDIQGQRLLGYAPESGGTVEHSMPSMPGFVTGRRKGGLLIGLEDGIYAFDPRRSAVERIVAVEADDERTRVNDGRADSVGRLWFGTMDKSGSGAPIGALYRMDPDLSVHKIRSEVRVPNSIEFSPDGRRMYFADSRTRAIEVIEYDPATGTAGTSSTFARFAEPIVPDGSCVDAAGTVWTALIGGSRIECRTADGALIRTICLPVSRPTMAILGGRDGSTLFVTSQRRFLSSAALAAEPLAGDLLALRVPAAARNPFLAGV